MAYSVYIFWLWHHHCCCADSSHHPASFVYSNSGYIIDETNFICSMYMGILPHKCMSSNMACSIFLVFEGHLCCWHIFCSSMVNKSYGLLIFNSCVHNVGSICRLHYKCSVTFVQCNRHICSGIYASNVECMYTSAPGHITYQVSSYEVFIWA